MEKVGIIMVVWNDYKSTLRALKSLSDINYTNIEICIVDNGSTDNSIYKIKQSYPDHIYLKNNSNKGFAHGVNRGIKYGLEEKWDYFLLLNNDVEVSKNFINELVRVISANDEIGVVGPRILYLNCTEKIWFTGGLVDVKKGPFIHMYQDSLDQDVVQDTEEVDYINGCCMLIRSSAILKCGFFSEKYFMYVEDIDYVFRMKKNGYKSVIVPSVRILHDVSASSGGLVNPRKEFYKSMNLFVFIKKNINFKDKFRWIYYSCQNNIFRSLVYFKKGNWRVALAIIAGVIMGIFK